MPDTPEHQTPPSNLQQPYATYPSPQFAGVPPTKPRSSSMRIVLIIAGIFLGICLLCTGVVGFGVWYFAKSAHPTSSANFTESDLGIAIYPGATPSKTGMRMQIGPMKMISAFYLTPDSTDQVIAFYKDKVGPDARVTTIANLTRIQAPTAGGNSVAIEVSPYADASGNKTRIKIDRATTSTASN